jgi:hypothetical protein
MTTKPHDETPKALTFLVNPDRPFTERAGLLMPSDAAVPSDTRDSAGRISLTVVVSYINLTLYYKQKGVVMDVAFVAAAGGTPDAIYRFAENEVCKQLDKRSVWVVRAIAAFDGNVAIREPATDGQIIGDPSIITELGLTMVDPDEGDDDDEDDDDGA